MAWKSQNVNMNNKQVYSQEANHSHALLRSSGNTQFLLNHKVVFNSPQIGSTYANLVVACINAHSRSPPIYNGVGRELPGHLTQQQEHNRLTTSNRVKQNMRTKMISNSSGKVQVKRTETTVNASVITLLVTTALGHRSNTHTEKY